MKHFIKGWLKEHGKDRQWLADMLGLTKSTINNWLSTAKIIPEAKHAVIRRIFESEEAEQRIRLQQMQPQNQIFSIEVTPESVKHWLKVTGRDRQWLADQCGVALQTAYHWISKGIPSKAEIIIGRLMQEDEDRAISIGQAPPQAYVTIETTLEEYRAWESVALSERKRLSDWVLDVVREAYAAEKNQQQPRTGTETGK